MAKNDTEKDASDTPGRHRCGTMQVHRRLMDTNPRYAEARERIEEHAFRHSRSFVGARPGCTKIPVVVHVVWKTEAQNVSDEQIHSQIDVLNQDFRKQNADVSSVPAPFAPLAGDARLVFELATRDPDGKPTGGITRRKTTETGFDSDDKVKSASSGGTDAWPADEYLNLWVCQMVGGLLGYAQFPGGPAATDGVVVTHTGFGTTGTAAAPFDKGRTATHEIGHWLNLRHIWGDDGDGCNGSDFVSDTPNQGGANVGKPTFPSVSCSNGPNGDMFMNYMDYVDDDTMVMFTQGQVERMQAALDGARSTIGSSVSCLPNPVLKAPPKDNPKEFIKELPKDPPKEFPKDGIKEFGKEGIKDPPKEFGKEGIKDPPKEFGKEGPKDPPKEFGKDFGKDGPFDTGGGGKSPILDGGGPHKSFLEPPVQVQPPVFQPTLPPAVAAPAFGNPQMPFVLATGGVFGQDPQREPLINAYTQMLGQYAQLNAQGLLDAQGQADWQQAYASYVQLMSG